MGGYGSGRWGTAKSDAKTLVTSCHALDVDSLTRRGIVGTNVNHWASWEWLGRGGTEIVASIGLQVWTDSNSGAVRLQYRIGESEGGMDLLAYRIPLVTTRLPSRGLRWWLQCAASRDGGPTCGRRVRILYLPPRGRVFGCRCCHDLAYESSRDSRKYASLFNRLGSDMGLDGRTVAKVLDRRLGTAAKPDDSVRGRGRVENRPKSSPQY